MTPSDRIEYIDLAKGICILLVVLDHISDYGFFSDGNYPLNDIFEQTRMPLYFILSGLFFKDYQGGIREFLLRKTNRILVPYLFFMCVYKLFPLLTDVNIGPVWAPLWFLVCLFWMNAVFAALYYLTKRFFTGVVMEITLGICVLGIGIGGYFCQLPLNFDTAMTSLPFLWMGYLLNRKLHLLQAMTKWQWTLPAGIALLAALHYTYVGENLFYINTYGTPLPLIYLTGLMGTLGILMLSSVVGWLPLVSYIGRYSIIVLCTHMAVVKAVMAGLSLLPVYKNSDYWQDNTTQSFVLLTITLTCSVFLCWFLSRYLPWFTAQKDLITTRLTQH